MCKKGLFIFDSNNVRGGLTQYYFLIFQFFLSFFFCICFLTNRKYKQLMYYTVSMIAGIILQVMVYPDLLFDLLKGSRGREAVHNIFSFNGYFERIRLWGNLIHIHVCYGAAVFVFFLFIFCIGYARMKRAVRADKKRGFIAVLFLTICFYLLIIMKIAPYIVPRYICLTIPVIYLIFVYEMYQLSVSFPKSKMFCYGLLLLMPLFICNSYRKTSVPYVMKEETFIQQSEIVKGIPTLVLMGKQKWRCYCNFDELMLVEKLYMHYDSLQSPIPDDVWELLGRKQCVVYISSELNQSEMLAWIKEKTGYSKEKLLFQNVNYTYLLEK